MRGPHRPVAARVITDPATVEDWRGRFNRLRPAPPGTARSCPPIHDAGRLRIAFVAAPQEYTILSATVNGCRTVRNGMDLRDAWSTAEPYFSRHLGDLVRG